MCKPSRANLVNRSVDMDHERLMRVTPGKSVDRNYLRLVTVFFALSFYTLLFWGGLPYLSSIWPAYIAFTEKIIGIDLPDYQTWVLGGGLHLFLIPLFVGRFLLKMPFGKMGIRGISSSQVKVLIVLYLFALPFLVWLATREDMYYYYEFHIKETLWKYLIWTNLHMLCEHVFLQGIFLSFLEPSFFEESVGEVAKPVNGRKEVNRVEKERRERWGKVLKDWLRVDRYYLIIFLLDGVLFMLIHVGKPLSEIFLAFPGGVFLAFLAFRFGSFLPCYLIHAMTGGTIISLIILLH